MTIEQLKTLHFFNENDFDEFTKDIKGLSVIELKELAVKLNNIAEAKKENENSKLSPKLNVIVDMLEQLTESDYTLIFDVIESKEQNRGTIINRKLTIFSDNAKRLANLIERMDNQMFEQSKKLVYYYHEIFVRNKELSRSYANTFNN